eukprot:COSAG03_NODE_11_length_23018_cov_29.686461_18_plen_176_part_00
MLLLGLNWAARPSFLSSPLHRSGLLRRPGKPLLRRLRGSAGLRTKRCSGGTARDTTAWFRTACSAPVRARNRPAATPSLRVGTTAAPPHCRGLCRRWTCLPTTHTHRNEEQTPFESLRGLLGFAGPRYRRGYALRSCEIHAIQRAVRRNGSPRRTGGGFMELRFGVSGNGPVLRG